MFQIGVIAGGLVYFAIQKRTCINKFKVPNVAVNCPGKLRKLVFLEIWKEGRNLKITDRRILGECPFCLQFLLHNLQQDTPVIIDLVFQGTANTEVIGIVEIVLSERRIDGRDRRGVREISDPCRISCQRVIGTSNVVDKTSHICGVNDGTPCKNIFNKRQVDISFSGGTHFAVCGV